MKTKRRTFKRKTNYVNCLYDCFRLSVVLFFSEPVVVVVVVCFYSLQLFKLAVCEITLETEPEEKKEKENSERVWSTTKWWLPKWKRSDGDPNSPPTAHCPLTSILTLQLYFFFFSFLMSADRNENPFQFLYGISFIVRYSFHITFALAQPNNPNGTTYCSATRKRKCPQS